LSPTLTVFFAAACAGAALDGLRLSVLLSGEDPAWLRDAVRRQLRAWLV
jgi:hypothetical protein